MRKGREAIAHRLELQMGALCAPIGAQLRQQGARASVTELAHWQRDAEAITRLQVRGLLSDTVAHKARQRLCQRIAQRVTFVRAARKQAAPAPYPPNPVDG